jgi:uncharacterized Zn finger protein (UPF0148 family)
MRQITPKVTAEDRLMNEARDTGNQCPRCGYWNLRHRHMCRRCGKRVRQSKREEASRAAQAIFRRRRHQPSNPPLAKIRPGSPAPAMGPGTLEKGVGVATKP